MLVKPGAEEKYCSKCKTARPIADFGVSRRRADGLNPQCKPCARESARATYRRMKDKDPARVNRNSRRANARWREENPEVNQARSRAWYHEQGGKQWSRAYALQKTYGLSLQEYEQRLHDQHGVCAICLKPETRMTRSGHPRPLHVDHDHATGVIRKLLCYACNSALGFFRDDPARMERAIEYVRTFSS